MGIVFAKYFFFCNYTKLRNNYNRCQHKNMQNTWFFYKEICKRVSYILLQHCKRHTYDVDLATRG